MPTTDYTHTNNPRSLHLAQMAIPFPEWIQSRPTPAPDELTKLAAVAFAEPSTRRLPIHDKEVAFFSAVDYFANVADYPARTFDAIKEASDHFDLGEDLAPYAEFFAGSFAKQAADSAPVTTPSRFAISTSLAGQEYQLLPLNDAGEIYKSACELQKMVSEKRVHYLMFVGAAREIVKAAAETPDTPALPFLVASAGEERFEDLDKAAAMIASRKPLVAHHADAYAAYTGAVQDARAGTITPEECMQKIAAIDDALDIRYNYSPHARTPLPHVIVFGGPSIAEVTKVASTNVVIRGVPVPLRVLASLRGLEVDYGLSKAAAEEWRTLRDLPDAIPISHAVEKWAPEDQRLLLRWSAAKA